MADNTLVAPSRRIRVLRVSTDAIVSLLSTGFHAFSVEGLPDDAKVVGIELATNRLNHVDIYLESDEFDLLPPTYSPLLITPTITDYDLLGLTIRDFVAINQRRD